MSPKGKRRKKGKRSDLTLHRENKERLGDHLTEEKKFWEMYETGAKGGPKPFSNWFQVLISLGYRGAYSRRKTPGGQGEYRLGEVGASTIQRVREHQETYKPA